MSKPSKHPLCILCKCLRILLLGRSTKTRIYPVCITEYEHSLRLLDKKRLEVKMYNSIKIVSNSNHLINIVKSSKSIVFLLCSSFDQWPYAYDQCFVQPINLSRPYPVANILVGLIKYHFCTSLAQSNERPGHILHCHKRIFIFSFFLRTFLCFTLNHTKRRTFC